MPTLALLGGSHIHTPGFAKTMAETDGIDVKYVWDADPAVAKERQAVTGGKVIDDPQPALDDEAVDAVVICSETRLHEQLVLPSAKAGKHLFVEKPLGMGRDDSVKMAKAIREAGVLFQTGYFMRGNPAFQKVRELATSGTLGAVTRVRLSNCHAGVIAGWLEPWTWMLDPKQAGGGGLADLGTHVLDLLLWIVGNHKVQIVTGAHGTVTGRHDDIDEFGEAMLRLDSGMIATIAGSWVDHANPNFLEITGTQGHARVSNGKLYLKGPAFPDGDGANPRDRPSRSQAPRLRNVPRSAQERRRA